MEAEAHEIWVSAWHPNPPEDYYHSIMIHCPVPSQIELNKIERVLISEDPCDYSHAVMLSVTNTEQIQSTEENTKDFCVCLKPLDFPNEPRLASRLMEWIESNLQLGAQKIVIYVYSGTLAYGAYASCAARQLMHFCYLPQQLPTSFPTQTRYE